MHCYSDRLLYPTIHWWCCRGLQIPGFWAARRNGFSKVRSYTENKKSEFAKVLVFPAFGKEQSASFFFFFSNARQ